MLHSKIEPLNDYDLFCFPLSQSFLIYRGQSIGLDLLPLFSSPVHLKAVNRIQFKHFYLSLSPQQQSPILPKKLGFHGPKNIPKR